MIKILIGLSHRIAKFYDNQAMDFRKFNEHFQMSMVKELDFSNELINLERCRGNFKDYPDLYMP